MKLLITGDTHRNAEQFEYLRYEFDKEPFDACIICGDFGIGFRDAEKDSYLNGLEKYPFDILFVDGNHENFDYFNSLEVKEWNGGKVHFLRNNIIHLMRGEIYTINNKKLFTYGGGYSIDKERRLLSMEWGSYKCWWKEELPSEEEYNNALNNLKKNDWKIDYVFTHSAPISILPLIQEFFISPDKKLSDSCNEQLEEINKNLKFKEWHFGHYHGDKNIDNKFFLHYKMNVRREL